MSFFQRPISVTENNVTREIQKGSWRDRFMAVTDWAQSNPWDQTEKPDEKEIKLCINEFLEAIALSAAGFRFIQNKCDENGPESPRVAIQTAAKDVANILEGC